MASLSFDLERQRRVQRLEEDLRVLERIGGAGRQQASYLFLARVQDFAIREEVCRLPKVLKLVSQYAADGNIAVSCNFLRIVLCLVRSDMTFTRRATPAVFPTFAPAEPMERKRYRQETVFFGSSLEKRLATFGSRAYLLPHGRSAYDRRRLQALGSPETIASLMSCLEQYRSAIDSSEGHNLTATRRILQERCILASEVLVVL